MIQSVWKWQLFHTKKNICMTMDSLWMSECLMMIICLVFSDDQSWAQPNVLKCCWDRGPYGSSPSPPGPQWNTWCSHQISLGTKSDQSRGTLTLVCTATHQCSFECAKMLVPAKGTALFAKHPSCLILCGTIEHKLFTCSMYMLFSTWLNHVTAMYFYDCLKKKNVNCIITTFLVAHPVSYQRQVLSKFWDSNSSYIFGISA